MSSGFSYIDKYRHCDTMYILLHFLPFMIMTTGTFDELGGSDLDKTDREIQTAESVIEAGKRWFEGGSSQEREGTDRNFCLGVSRAYKLLGVALQGTDGGLAQITKDQEKFLQEIMRYAVTAHAADNAVGGTRKFQLNNGDIAVAATWILQLRSSQNTGKQPRTVADIASDQHAGVAVALTQATEESPSA